MELLHEGHFLELHERALSLTRSKNRIGSVLGSVICWPDILSRGWYLEHHDRKRSSKDRAYLEAR